MGDAVRNLLRFHTTHKLLLLAHSPERYRELGRMVAAARPENVAHFSLLYAAGFVAAMETSPTRGRQVNVLQHIAGYLRDHLPDAKRRELENAISRYQTGAVPLETPLAMIATFAQTYQVDYLRQQVYLEPYFASSSTSPAQ